MKNVRWVLKELSSLENVFVNETRRVVFGTLRQALPVIRRNTELIRVIEIRFHI